MPNRIEKPPPRRLAKSLLLTLPVLLWALLMFSGTLMLPGRASKAAALLALSFMVTLFLLMMRTRETHRWRRVFFVALGFLFPIGFVWELIAVRGSMSIPIEQMLAGNTPFCFLAIPMMIVPAALTRTIIFPGTILPTPGNPHSIAVMIGLWLAATIVLGKGWCSFGCFFGGLEEGFSTLARKARIRNISAKWRLVPWAVLAAIVLLSAATFEPVYCTWLCPFKTVTEYVEVRSLETAVQAGIFLSLFAGLVVALPVLTKKRTQCAFFCPFGAFQ
ncbi:MAG: 4Fe-4S binding protein, partial [Acidobacteriota bacterium]